MNTVRLMPGAWVLGVVAVALAGCVSAPDVQPQVSALDSKALGLSQTAAPPVVDTWWHALGDPQLDRLVEKALEENPSLGQALARLGQARAQALAAGAASQPGFTLDGDETWQRLSENYIYPPAEAGFGVAGGDTTWLGQVGLNMSWDLDFWGRQARLLDQAKAQVAASQWDYASAQLALSGAIVRSYVALYQAYAYTDIATRSEQQRQELLDITQQRVKAGLDTDIELKTAEAQLPLARAERLQAETQRDLAVHNLAALSGEGAQAYDRIKAPRLNLNAALPLPGQLPLDLLARRPDVQAARARVESMRAGRAAAKAAFYPNINLKAFAGLQAIGLDNLLDSGSVIYGAGPALHLPVFSSKRLKAGYLGATAGLDDAIANYNGTVLNAVRETADQLSQAQFLAQQIAQVQQVLNASEAAFALAQKRYQAGLSPQLVVLNAESNVLDARRKLVALQSQLLVSRVALLLTTGGSLTSTQSHPRTQSHSKTQSHSNGEHGDSP